MSNIEKDIMEISKKCSNCRYNRRSVFCEPCRTGIHMIHYSGACAAYRPSLWAIIKGLIRKKDGDHHEGI